MARNKIRRCLLAILDPHPTAAETGEIWEYFQSECAYCGAALSRADRNGHLDHVLAAAEGGSNSIHNHVLSCARCNGDEKREENWLSFLGRKAPTPEVAAERRNRIESWLSRGAMLPADSAREAKVATIVDGALSSFDLAVKNMRELRRGGI